MKYNSNLNSPERILFSGLLILEQVLGKTVFKILMPFKTYFLNYLDHKISSEINNEVSFKIEEVESISPEEFQEKFAEMSIPVVFRGAAKDWECCKKWDLDYFKFGYGEKDLLLVNANGLTSRENNSNFEFLTVRDLVENIKSGGKKYLRFSPLLENNPELVKDIDMNWLQKMRGGKTFARTYYMFMGGKGQKTLLHTDQPCNLYIQIFGEKKWTLISPKDTPLMYPEISNTAYVKSPIDIDKPDFKKYPLYKYATKYEVILKPGDVLYVPPHIWHFVENLTDTISVGYRYSSLKAAFSSSPVLTWLRILSTNPPIWKTMEYGKKDTNLIWGHTGGKIKEIMHEWELRSRSNKN